MEFCVDLNSSEITPKTTPKEKKAIFQYRLNQQGKTIDFLCDELKNTANKVRVKCRVCLYEWEASPSNLLSQKGCVDCNGKRQLKTATEYQDYLDRHGINITFIDEVYPSSNKTPCRHKCNKCGHDWMASRAQYTRTNPYGCVECANEEKRVLKYTKEDYDQKLIDAGITNIVHVGEFLGMGVSTNKHRCLVCDCNWETRPCDLLGKKEENSGCPACSGKKTPTEEEVKEQLAKLHPSIRLIGQYTMKNEKALFKCTDCNQIWETIPKVILNGHGCRNCNMNSNALYHWGDDNGMTKIGVTSQSLKFSRIRQCANARGTNVVQCRIVKTNDAYIHEQHILNKMFTERVYHSGCGHTEFRNLDENDLKKLDEYFDQFESHLNINKMV